ncbi:MAG: caspase family protein [Hyphomicrobiales bacterium]|nr:caspase family protein [Hyphomicrobiales bacterium]MCP5374097.1 caspase family protein [Hyphomicrobiales bacterium]
MATRSMWRTLVLAMAGWLAVAAASLADEAPARLALVIGNWSYESAPLKNPKNDVRAMAKVLQDQGFEVMTVENGTQRDMRKAILRFGWALRETRGVGLFYYAGHGMQVKGRNYLVPVDAIVNFEEEVPIEAVDVATVLSRMEAAENAMNLVILDACRNNPFARSFRSAAKGLASIDAPAGTLLAYATAPGSVAADGSGDNGLYTEELVRAIQVPGQPVEAVFKQVRSAVKERSDGQQVPWESTSLEGEFYFLPKQAEKPAAPAATATADPATGATRGAFAGFRQGEGQRRLGHYSTADGLVGFVFDRTGDAPAILFDGGDEVLTLEPKVERDRTVFVRDDGTHLVRVAENGDTTLWITGRGLVSVARDGGADALRLAGTDRAAVEARAADAATAIESVLGKPVPVRIDWAAFSDSHADLGTLAAALGSLRAAFEGWRGDDLAVRVVAGEVNAVRLARAAAASVTQNDGTVTLGLAPDAGLAGRPSSFRLAEVLAGQSLKRLRGQQAAEDFMRARLERTRAACGAEIALTVDWADWPGENLSLRGWCDAALDALDGLCRHPVGAAAVRRGIRGLACRRGPERRLDLADGVLTLTYDGRGANNRDFTHRFLMDNL